MTLFSWLSFDKMTQEKTVPTEIKATETALASKYLNFNILSTIQGYLRMNTKTNNKIKNTALQKQTTKHKQQNKNNTPPKKKPTNKKAQAKDKTRTNNRP